MLGTLNVESNSREGDLDARDVEMSKKVRRSYSRLETLGSASTSTPGRRSCFGSEGLPGAGDLAGVSPVVCSKLPEAPKVPEKTWAPDTTLPGISPPVVKEKRKKKVPEILVSEGAGSFLCRHARHAGRHGTQARPGLSSSCCWGKAAPAGYG